MTESGRASKKLSKDSAIECSPSSQFDGIKENEIAIKKDIN